MWLFIWFLFAVFIVGATAWSVQILFVQRAAWKTFCEKHNLTWHNGQTMLSSPVLRGKIGDFDFGLFSEQQPSADGRLARFYTVIEIGLEARVPTYAVIATSTRSDLVNALPLTQTFKPEHPGWDESWILKTTDIEVTKKFLTPARVEFIKKVFGMKIAAGILAFDGGKIVLRLETVDPMQNAEKLDKIVSGLIQQSSALQLNDQEKEFFAGISNPVPPVVSQPEPQEEPKVTAPLIQDPNT